MRPKFLHSYIISDLLFPLFMENICLGQFFSIRKAGGFYHLLRAANSPFYSCVLGCQAFEPE